MARVRDSRVRDHHDTMKSLHNTPQATEPRLLGMKVCRQC